MKMKKLFGVMAFAALSMVMFNACKDDDDKDSGIKVPEAYQGTYPVGVQATVGGSGGAILADERVDLTLSKKGEVAASFTLFGYLQVSVNLTLSDLKEINGVYYFKIKNQTATKLDEIGEIKLEGTHNIEDIEGGYDGYFKTGGTDRFIYFEAHGPVPIPGQTEPMDMLIIVDSAHEPSESSEE
jgi:hypothetical protein